MNKTNSTNIMIKNSSKIYFEKKPYGRIFFLFYFFFGKSPVKYVFSATSSTSIFVPKNETYDDTRRSCRNYYVLQGTQSNL